MKVILAVFGRISTDVLIKTYLFYVTIKESCMSIYHTYTLGKMEKKIPSKKIAIRTKIIRMYPVSVSYTN